jgi:hypothetical protein
MRRLLVLFLLVLVGAAGQLPTAHAATKQSRIPRFITDAGAYTGSFRESTNFVVRWGDAVDVVQWARVNRGIDDYPAYVLDKMEQTYAYYKNVAGFIDPDSISPGRDYRINFQVRYSAQFAPNQTATFALQSGETHLMLAVAATPSVHKNYAEGAQIDSFPYQLTIRGATPAAGNT